MILMGWEQGRMSFTEIKQSESLYLKGSAPLGFVAF